MTLTILYIDDDPVNIQVVQRCLNRTDAELHSALDAHDGIRQAETILPDVILMDVDLPGGMDGIDTIKIIKSDPKLAEVPVIILTSEKTYTTA